MKTKCKALTENDFKELMPMPGINRETNGYKLLGHVQLSVPNGLWTENFVKSESGEILHFAAAVSGVDQKGTVVTIERALEIIKGVEE